MVSAKLDFTLATARPWLGYGRPRLGSGGHGSDDILSGNLTTAIAHNVNKSTAQVALKWLVDKGAAVATKSSNPAHLAEDIDLYDWTLSDGDTAKLDAAAFAKGDAPSFMCDN